MSVPPVTVNGVRPYSDTPVVVGPSQVDFASVLGTAVATSATSTTATSTTATSTTAMGRSAAIGASSAMARSGVTVSSTGALVTTTGRNLLTLGQMVGSGMASSSSPLGTASISRPITSLTTPLVSTATTGTSSSSGAQAPAALLQYGNGKIPVELLTPIGINSHRLYAPAAEGFIAMRAAAAAEGIDIGVTDSYRTYEQQVDLAARKGLYKNGGLAAVPGTSKHGWGMAVDIDVDPAGLAWMRANAERFGFVENVPREPWHWEFVGANT